MASANTARTIRLRNVGSRSDVHSAPMWRAASDNANAPTPPASAQRAPANRSAWAAVGVASWGAPPNHRGIGQVEVEPPQAQRDHEAHAPDDPGLEGDLNPGYAGDGGQDGLA